MSFSRADRSLNAPTLGVEMPRDFQLRWPWQDKAGEHHPPCSMRASWRVVEQPGIARRADRSWRGMQARRMEDNQAGRRRSRRATPVRKVGGAGTMVGCCRRDERDEVGEPSPARAVLMSPCRDARGAWRSHRRRWRLASLSMPNAPGVIMQALSRSARGRWAAPSV